VSAITACQASERGCCSGNSDASVLASNVHPVPGLSGLIGLSSDETDEL
jgi:hypothetical protein